MNEHIGLVKAILFAIYMAIGSALSYLGLNHEMIGLFVALLVVDYITGLAKARRLNISITSQRMKYGIVSKFVLLLIPIAVAIAAKIVGVDYDKILYIGINILALSELYSILGNIYSIRTRQELPEYDAVAAIGHRVRKFLLKLEGDDVE
ncbi:hypothetical protein NrS5_56 [Nitratiruptor phage NrS-5]|uniref:phage holin family protein n=1 Tax=unclassified Nitratiruptor TaxID=2624044 RepID=UPI0019163DC2|nr:MULTISPECIES: phage holin family protein [unclassified Nitratiruptor]BCD61760.1 hypothetical protein NitYY0813_C0620 [Nitratiruptor sp. YY08-13]BCD65695.1 hypothetical protein NitYY0826_C0622 [Nitratiruptor sp. YY08-26]BCD83238.1 hypothetical protein NrS4_56 [Nitratiruptor phage NrS-4]BCD83297.1 hypothetical protein NrS5_56 [Nitratiruptor phage NrS-5]